MLITTIFETGITKTETHSSNKDYLLAGFQVRIRVPNLKCLDSWVETVERLSDLHSALKDEYQEVLCYKPVAGGGSIPRHIYFHSASYSPRKLDNLSWSKFPAKISSSLTSLDLMNISEVHSDSDGFSPTGV